MVAPHRSNRRKCSTQDGRRLRRYTRRWLVERSGFNGSAAFLSAGSFIRRTSLASCNSPASRTSSNDFEIGSRCSVPAYDGTDLQAVDKDGTWARFYTGAPARRRLSVERYTIVKRA